MVEAVRHPSDRRQREEAIDITRSCIVQAPAGSGKTELLVQRILALLAVVERPEEILSITFTRKAAAEMRVRLQRALERAGDERAPDLAHELETWRRARKVRKRDAAMGWQLLQTPSRLQLLTIDSLCAQLTRRMPWTARFGDQPTVTDEPGELYREAAEELLNDVERDGPGQAAIEQLLGHVDNRMPLLRGLLEALLARRDQWLRHLLAQQHDAARRILQESLRRYVDAALDRVRATLGDALLTELVELARFAADTLGAPHPFHDAPVTAPEQLSREQWLALAELLLTASGSVRKSVTRAQGFPADRSDRCVAMKQRMKSLLETLADTDGAASEIVSALQSLRQLPQCGYSDAQWSILDALVELLPLAVLALREVFRRRGLVDFVEIAGAARAALGTDSAPEELLLSLDSRIRHILVDEFQDTSWGQYELLCSLTAGWTPGDGRTLFVVGDPMQSIYRFREAEVGLFLRCWNAGLGELPLDRILLDTNFRSTTTLVDWVNQSFAGLFPQQQDEILGAVPFAPATAFNGAEQQSCVSVHGFVDRQDEAEAATIVGLIHEARVVDPDGSIAVLVRSRSHLAELVKVLKRAQLPFQAQDIDPLALRPAVTDLLSLLRALQHPGDRVAWLAVLRAPWCGLTLTDLERLCAGRRKRTVWQILSEPAAQGEMFDPLSADGRRRLDRIVPILAHAMVRRWRSSPAHLLEATWLALGGAACIDEADLENVRQLFALIDAAGWELSQQALDERLARLYAVVDPQADGTLQLMTIHKAKGLEFDTVIMPGLGRGVRGRERSLLRWQESPDGELLLAPLPPLSSEEQDATYDAIGSIHQQKDELETLRLCYVAVTRARRRLHLLGHFSIRSDDQAMPLKGSLLAAAWSVLGEAFVSGARSADAAVDAVATGPVTLRRLPANWSLPPLAEPLGRPQPAAKTASATSGHGTERSRSRRTEEGRVIGTLVHAWLEKIAEEGLEAWSAEKLRGKRDYFAAELLRGGVPLDRVDGCLSQLLSCLENSVRTERGRWLLGRQQDAHSELPLNGLVADELLRTTVDRTFVCDGDRWVIDYKTGCPAAKQDPGAFMVAEAKRYAGQLDAYADLLGRMDPAQRVRKALYFPAFDGWIEL
jgi:ATP-dependent exoDNAse (exonuclease V) beta subunit